jgi:predicted Zn-dependent peptidase
MILRVGEAFGSWQPGDVPDAGPPPPERTPVERFVWIVDQPDLVQARVAVAHEGIARTDDDRVAANLMNSMLGGSGFSSRLMASLRADAGLTYGVYSRFHLRREPSLFSVGTFTRISEVRRVIDLLLFELERMRSEPPTDAELTAAQMLAAGNFSLGLETSHAVMGGLVDLDVYGLPEESLDTYRSRVRDVTSDDTARMAQRLLHPERIAIVLVGPAEALRPQVEDLGPVTIITP